MKYLFPKYWIYTLFLLFAFNIPQSSCHHHGYGKHFSCYFNLMTDLKEMHCVDLININYRHVTTPALEKLTNLSELAEALNLQSSENDVVQHQGNHVVKKANVDPYMERNIHHCVVFRPYDVKKYGNHPYTGSTFMCDYKGFCDGLQNGLISGLSINGEEGELYCCNTTGCNNLYAYLEAVDRELISEAKVSHCYQGIANHIATNSCGVPSSGCQILTEYSPVHLTVYQCNAFRPNLCHMFDIKDGECRNVSYPDVGSSNSTLCCCYSNNCNHPPLSKLQKLLNLRASKGQLTVISLGIMWGLLTVLMVVGLVVYVVVRRYGSWRKMPVLRTWSYSTVDDALYRNMDEETYSGLLGRLY